MNLETLFLRIGIALGIGLLIGLQRESTKSHLAGIRTFPIIALLGSLSSLLAQHFGNWILVASFVILALTIVLTQIPEIKRGKGELDFTSLVVLLLVFCLGAYLTIGSIEVAVAIGGSVAVLLQFKGELHGFVYNLGEQDLRAIMTFALISLVILPALPDHVYGPYQVLNPRQIWWMVVLVSGISLSGYVVYKFFGQRAGMLAGGVLGGLISSTATTMGYSRQTRVNPELNNYATVIILIASAIVYLRLIIEIVVVSPGFIYAASIPLAVSSLILFASASIAWFSDNKMTAEVPDQENPAEIKTAIVFGLLYALVILGSAFAKDFFGVRGLYGVATLAGLTDVDAITLSTSQLINAGQLSQSDGWKLILTATLSNLFFKSVIVALLAHRNLFFRVAPYYLATFIAGLIMIIFV